MRPPFFVYRQENCFKYFSNIFFFLSAQPDIIAFALAISVSEVAISETMRCCHSVAEWGFENLEYCFCPHVAINNLNVANIICNFLQLFRALIYNFLQVFKPVFCNFLQALNFIYSTKNGGSFFVFQQFSLIAFSINALIFCLFSAIFLSMSF